MWKAEAELRGLADFAGYCLPSGKTGWSMYLSGSLLSEPDASDGGALITVYLLLSLGSSRRAEPVGTRAYLCKRKESHGQCLADHGRSRRSDVVMVSEGDLMTTILDTNPTRR